MKLQLVILTETRNNSTAVVLTLQVIQHRLQLFVNGSVMSERARKAFMVCAGRNVHRPLEVLCHLPVVKSKPGE